MKGAVPAILRFLQLNSASPAGGLCGKPSLYNDKYLFDSLMRKRARARKPILQVFWVYS